MSSLSDVSVIPTEGKDLIVVATVNNVLHFRIFDGDGKVVVDTDEKKLPEQAQQIKELRYQLVESLWTPYELTRSDKHEVITAVTSIVGHQRPCDCDAIVQRLNISGPLGWEEWQSAMKQIDEYASKRALLPHHYFQLGRELAAYEVEVWKCTQWDVPGTFHKLPDPSPLIDVLGELPKDFAKLCPRLKSFFVNEWLLHQDPEAFFLAVEGKSDGEYRPLWLLLDLIDEEIIDALSLAAIEQGDRESVNSGPASVAGDNTFDPAQWNVQETNMVDVEAANEPERSSMPESTSYMVIIYKTHVKIVFQNDGGAVESKEFSNDLGFSFIHYLLQNPNKSFSPGQLIRFVSGIVAINEVDP
jgi:hypothetical protein